MVRPLRHGYTNDVRGDAAVIIKSFVGPDRFGRRARELLALTRLRGLVPIPKVLPAYGDALHLGFVQGVQGQEMIEAGHATEVLRACGNVLRQIHGLDPAHVFSEAGLALGPGDVVIVHGDFGPNNVLIDRATYVVTAVLDWEWAHLGQPVEDVAWCEWIIRAHHAAHVDRLGDFFDAYGHQPSWPERHAAMLAQCRWLLHLCHGWTEDGVRLWERRLEMTAAWTE